MKQREVTDKENVKWTCVQAYSGMQEKLSEKAAEIIENGDGRIPVVCTPTGGAQSVRLELQNNWIEQLQDDELIDAIAKAQE